MFFDEDDIMGAKIESFTKALQDGRIPKSVIWILTANWRTIKADYVCMLMKAVNVENG